jgi:hypothetical protein
MEQQSSKHSSRQDDELKHELHGTLHSGQQTHTEEVFSSESAGEDQPPVARSIGVPDEVGTPAGLNLVDLERRSETASYLGKEVWPADRNTLIARALDSNAPDRVLDELRRLPSGRQYATLNEAWAAMGHSVEAHRR